MTGVDTTDVVLDALRGQKYDFLAKPIEPVRLIEIVKRALSTKASASNIDVYPAAGMGRVTSALHPRGSQADTEFPPTARD